MPEFVCKIGTSDGRVAERVVEATDLKSLKAHLEEQGIFLFHARRPYLSGILPRSRPRWNGRKFLAFNTEFLVLIRAGMPILQVLDTIMERAEPGAFLTAMTEIREEVKSGGALSDAFEKYPSLFPYLYVASIKAGERTGDLPTTISRYIQYQKRVEAIKAKMKSASFYPAILVSAVIGVLIFLLSFVIPSFTQIYADAQVDLPLVTRVLIFASEGLLNGFPLWILLTVGLVTLVRVFLRTASGERLFDTVKLKAPFFGGLLVDYALADFSRTLSTILSSGIPAVAAMRMSMGTLNNCILEEKLGKGIQRIEEGSLISEAFSQTGFFPVLALRMVAVGENTGSLAEMLTEVSEYYEMEVERRLERLTTVIEPMLMLVMGLLIGGVVVAMYIPIFQLAGTAAR